MAYPSVTYSFTNGTTADATQVNQNFTDLINGLSDGTKDLSVKNIGASGKITVTETTDSTSGSTGSINTLGGLGVTKAIYCGSSITCVTSVISPLHTATAALEVRSVTTLTLNAGTTLAINVANATTPVVGATCSAASAWVIGPTVTGGVDGQVQTINTGDQGANVAYAQGTWKFCNNQSTRCCPTLVTTTTDSDSFWGMGLIAAVVDNVSGNIADMVLQTRENDGTDFSGSYNTNVAFMFRRFATSLGECTRAGAWMLGPSSGLTTAHLVRGSNVVTGEIIRIENTANATSFAFFKSNGSDVAQIGANATNAFVLNTGAGTNLGLCTQAGAWYMPALGSGAGTYALKWTTSSGLLTYDTSYRGFKDDIEDSRYGLSAALSLRPREFKYKTDGRPDVGFIADEVYSVIPELAPLMEEGLLLKNGSKELVPGGVSYDRITAVCIKAIQELAAENDSLRARIAALEAA